MLLPLAQRMCCCPLRQVRTDKTYPVGFMDVVTIPKTDEHFRLVYDAKVRARALVCLPTGARGAVCSLLHVALFAHWCAWYGVFSGVICWRAHHATPMPTPPSATALAQGRFVVHRISKEEAAYKLCKVRRVQFGKGGVPFIATHDGRTIRYPDPDIKVRGAAANLGWNGCISAQASLERLEDRGCQLVGPAGEWGSSGCAALR